MNAQEFFLFQKALRAAGHVDLRLDKPLFATASVVWMKSSGAGDLDRGSVIPEPPHPEPPGPDPVPPGVP